jgi:hypothetical protein
MAKLTTKARNKLKSSTFAGPNRSYPIPDRSHGIFAEAMAAKHASPAERKKIDAAVHKKYPNLGKSKSKSK